MTQTTIIKDMQWKIVATVIAAMLVIADSAQAAIVFNEFDYDNLGSDTAEFVELYNPDVNPQILDGLSLVFFNGATISNTAYLTIALSGSIPPGGFFTIGNNVAGLSLDITPNTDAIQNGAPDSLGIYSGTAPTAATATNLIPGTGFTYEGTNAGIPAEFELLPGADPNASNVSLQRIPDGTGTFVLLEPTPSVANVPEPASLASLVAAGGLALVRRRRRS